MKRKKCANDKNVTKDISRLEKEQEWQTLRRQKGVQGAKRLFS
jgi:hypothetical protein